MLLRQNFKHLLERKAKITSKQILKLSCMRKRCLEIFLWTLIIPILKWPVYLLWFQKRRPKNSLQVMKNSFSISTKMISLTGKREIRPKLQWLIKTQKTKVLLQRLLKLKSNSLLLITKKQLLCQVWFQEVQNSWMNKMRKVTSFIESPLFKIKLLIT